MFAEARRLCDDDGGGGLRPRDVDMVGSQVLKSFSGVCGTASKGENSRSRGPGVVCGMGFKSDTATKAEAVDDCDDDGQPEARETQSFTRSPVSQSLQSNLTNSPPCLFSEFINSPCPCHNTHTSHNGYSNRSLRRQQGPRSGQHPLPAHVHSIRLRSK